MGEIKNLTEEELMNIEGGVDAWFNSESFSNGSGINFIEDPIVIESGHSPLAGLADPRRRKPRISDQEKKIER